MASGPAAEGSPGLDEPDWPADAVEVGRILGAWGVKGWIKVLPLSDDPQALFSSRRWFLQPPESGAGPRPWGAAGQVLPRMLRITQAREQGDTIVAAVRDLEDRDAAERLKGVRLFVARSSFPTAGDDEYYWVDLIGLAVHNRQGELIGNVVGLIDTGPHSVLRIEAPPPAGDGPSRPERLVPFVATYVDKVDLAARRIDVDWSFDF